MTAAQIRIQHLQDRGFDLAYKSGPYIRPKCSACEVLVINGMACHEHGCPNALHECRGCNALVPMNVRYCEECR